MLPSNLHSSIVRHERLQTREKEKSTLTVFLNKPRAHFGPGAVGQRPKADGLGIVKLWSSIAIAKTICHSAGLGPRLFSGQNVTESLHVGHLHNGVHAWPVGAKLSQVWPGEADAVHALTGGCDALVGHHSMY